MAYAAFSDVLARIPDRTIDSGTKPSQAQVQAWLDEGEAKLDGSLRAIGVGVPVTNAEGIKILRAASADWAEGRTRRAISRAGGDVNDTAGEDLVKGFEDFLAFIHNNPDRAGAMLVGGDAPDDTRGIRSHTLNNRDGKTVAAGDFAPTFTREDEF